MSKRFIFSSVILLALFICALFAPYLSSFDRQHVELSKKLMTLFICWVLISWVEMSCLVCCMGLVIPSFYP